MLRKPAMSDDAVQVDYSGTIIIYNMACHSTAQLIMSDVQTSMGDDILQMIVCLRDGRARRLLST